MLYARHPFPVNDIRESPGWFTSSFCCSKIFLSFYLQLPCFAMHNCFHSHTTDRSTLRLTLFFYIYCFCFLVTVLSNSVIISLPIGSETFIKGLMFMQSVLFSFFLVLCQTWTLAQILSIAFLLLLKALACWSL
ncbi:hypothetical protein XELAEV_18010296mg [Xenopus laevis]|uniref:Uncharacterized protein n=1 Tax=Xenopus laevis TaxID=8355 RepID=A0A974DU75_XENLA|nr:hypothetical protein XELAEV_18010296mg [Xenopus laevis]